MARAWEKSTHSYKTDHFIRVRQRDPDRGSASKGMASSPGEGR
jgi:hypothetical protein